MSNKRGQTLSTFPQYVSKVKRIITEQNVPWFPADTRKRGRSSSRLLQCNAETQSTHKQRQKPLPRNLSPLQRLSRKPSPNCAADVPRSGRGRSPGRGDQQDMSERVISGISRLVVPLPGYCRHGQSSCSSSNSSSPVPTSLVTLQLGCKSKESLSSGSSDQSPPAFKRATPTSLNDVGEDERNQPSVQLQRAASQNSLSVQVACSKSPYMAPLGLAKKTRRAKNSKPGRRGSNQLSTASSRETLATPITLLSRETQPVNQCSIKVWSPSESSGETATDDWGQRIIDESSVAVSAVFQQPAASGLCIPTITIRSATPVKAPGDDENLMALCEKLAFRAGMEEELEKLREEIKSLSDTSNIPQAPITP